jgi:hypothetical protein
MGKSFLSLLCSTENQVSAIRGYSFSNHAGLITQSFCTTKLENNLSKYKQTQRTTPGSYYDSCLIFSIHHGNNSDPDR